MAAIDRIMVLKFLHSLLGLLVAGVYHPSVGLHQDGWTQIFVAVPPVRGAGSSAAGAQDALVHSVQLSPIFHGLVMRDFPELLLTFALKVRLDLFVLIVEVGHVWHEILDDIHVREGVNFGRFGSAGVDSAETGQSVGAVDVHGATAADALAARPAEGQSRVQLVLNLDQTIQNHWTARVKVNFVGLFVGFLSRDVWVPSVNVEFLESGLGCRCRRRRSTDGC